MIGDKTSLRLSVVSALLLGIAIGVLFAADSGADAVWAKRVAYFCLIASPVITLVANQRSVKMKEAANG